jgi:L-cysteine:1D-myo-inositol 2-amino-2-deoxy-alpha-D-glucopyranoside ligase
VIAWPAPPVPRLPGAGRPVRLRDTSTGQTSPSAAGTGAATLYVCGITPYDATHIGHAATYLAFDLLVRAWRDAGREVRYVQNVTDIDDPLLQRAAATGQDWRDLARRETALFAEDMTALRVIPPDVYLGAVETIPWVLEAVGALVELGAAYRVPADGAGADVYFDVSSDARFGQVSNLTREQMLALFAERGGDPERSGKRHPLDPVLWRAARQDEPSWDGGPLGSGRPGWHIECVAIALRHLGVPFDVQGGGSDLTFPHHEMGASHGHVLTGSWPFARTYAHAGMVALDGEKMSKSRGNLVLVSRLRADGVDPMAIRLAVLAHHYRSDWSWTAEDLRAAQARLGRWREGVSRPAGPDGQALLERVRAHLADDLDAPSALAAVDRWVADRPGDDGDSEAPRLVADTVDALLGIPLRPTTPPPATPPPVIM